MINRKKVVKKKNSKLVLQFYSTFMGSVTMILNCEWIKIPKKITYKLKEQPNTSNSKLIKQRTKET